MTSRCVNRTARFSFMESSTLTGNTMSHHQRIAAVPCTSSMRVREVIAAPSQFDPEADVYLTEGWPWDVQLVQAVRELDTAHFLDDAPNVRLVIDARAERDQTQQQAEREYAREEQARADDGIFG
jgi:hypothetical protein